MRQQKNLVLTHSSNKKLTQKQVIVHQSPNTLHVAPTLMLRCNRSRDQISVGIRP